MARLSFHGVKDDWYGALDGAINSSVTSLVVDGAGAGGEPSVPFYFDIDTEALECTAVSVNTPSAGKSTLTVARGKLGTTAASHSDNAVVQQSAYAQHWTEQQNAIAALQVMLLAILGGGEGVALTSVGGTDLLVEAQSTPGMTVKINPGSALVSGQPVAVLATTNSGTITGPSVNPRIDIVQVDQYGVLSVKAGTEAGSPAAPSVDSGKVKLAEIYLRVGATSIKNSDDASNGYITDRRVFV